MAQTDDEVVEALRKMYRAEFGGKRNQRFLVAWSDLRSLYGFRKLFETRFRSLVEAAARRNVYLLDLGEGENGRLVAVVRTRTVDRWRRVPKRVVDEFRVPVDEDGTGDDEEE